MLEVSSRWIKELPCYLQTPKADLPSVPRYSIYAAVIVVGNTESGYNCIVFPTLCGTRFLFLCSSFPYSTTANSLTGGEHDLSAGLVRTDVSVY